MLVGAPVNVSKFLVVRPAFGRLCRGSSKASHGPFDQIYLGSGEALGLELVAFNRVEGIVLTQHKFKLFLGCKLEPTNKHAETCLKFGHLLSQYSFYILIYLMVFPAKESLNLFGGLGSRAI